MLAREARCSHGVPDTLRTVRREHGIAGRQFLVDVASGLVVLTLAAIGAWAWRAFVNADIPWGVAFVFVLAVGVGSLLMIPRSRQLVFSRSVRTWRWTSGLRVTTLETRAALEQTGYDRRSREVEAERRVARRPAWRVEARDRLGYTGIYFLENSGYGVSDVTLSCDSDLFELQRPVVWPGAFGDDQPGTYMARPFDGAPTERGTSEGVVFTIGWHDNNGDYAEEEVRLARDEIIAGEQETRDVAFAEGVAHGRKLEQEERAASAAPEPSWYANGPIAAGTSRWSLVNTNPGSYARSVRITALFGGRVADAGYWPELTGGDASSVGEFDFCLASPAPGAPPVFSVTWHDEEGEEHVVQVSAN